MYVQLGIYTRQDIYASLEAPAKQMQHFNATYRKIVGPAFAIPGQTITTFQCNKLQHCWRNMLRTLGHPVVMCCDICQSVSQSVSPSVCLSFRPSIRQSVSKSISQSVRQSVS